jgi:hypothetical protein
MKFEGVYFNVGIVARFNESGFKERFKHLWPGRKQQDREWLLTQAYQLLLLYANSI